MKLFLGCFFCCLALVACSDDESDNNANNANNANNQNANNQNNEGRCSPDVRPGEMWIDVDREDGEQLRDLDIDFTFENGQETWKCTEATLDGILCDARPRNIIAVAQVDERGEITDVSIEDPDGFAFSGPVSFNYEDVPSGQGCTFQRGTFEVTLTQ